MRFSLVSLLAVVLLAGAARAAPVAHLQSNIDISKHTQCVLPDDEVTLTISDGDKTLARKIFCSSYGKSEADVLKDARGVVYLLLDYGVGRGTNAVENYLEVDRLDASLRRIFNVMTSTATGPTTRFEYTHKAMTPKGGGLLLTFELHADPNSECCVPKQRQFSRRIH